MNSAASTVRVEPYSDDLWPLINVFWRGILGADWDDTARERWHWLNARRTHLVALERDRLLGNATLLRQSFVTPAEASLEVGWITDFYVSPELKGRGIGTALTKALQSRVALAATFGQSEAARRCFGRLGWTPPQWTPLLATTLPWFHRARGSYAEFDRVPYSSPVFNEVWTRRASEAHTIGLRDTGTMEQRLSGRPDADYEVWAMERKGTVRGWIVLRLIRGRRNRRFGRVPTGLIVDLLAVGGDEEVTRRMITFGTARLGRRGAALVLAVGSGDQVSRVLARVGFRPFVGLGPLRVRGLPRKGFMKSDSVPLAPFRLTFLDCDAELAF